MRLCPSWRGETTFRSSHHCNCRRLTPQIRATSLLLKPCASEEEAGRDFLPLNISRHFRCVNLVSPWIVHAPTAVSIGGWVSDKETCYSAKAERRNVLHAT